MIILCTLGRAWPFEERRRFVRLCPGHDDDSGSRYPLERDRRGAAQTRQPGADECLTPLTPPHAGRGDYCQTSSPISTIIRNLAHCSSSARMLPSSVEAKPHCGDRQNCSSGANLPASSMRRSTSSFFSSVPLLEVTRPSTTTLLPLGRKRSGSKPPARSVSYSRK